MSVTVTEKLCTGPCGEVKPSGDFARRSASADGLQPRCKACLRAQAKLRELTPEQKAEKIRWVQEKRAADPEYRARQRESNRRSAHKAFHTNPERRTYMLEASAAQGHKRRARMAGAEHEPYNRAEIFARWNGACAYCLAPAEHLDHVHPISKGGADAPHNLVPACAPCNLRKSAKSLADWALTD